MTVTAVQSRSSARPIPILFPERKAGSGQPHIICPIDMYISGARNTSDDIRRVRIRTNSSLLFKPELSCKDALSGFPAVVPVATAASYPAFSTAWIMSAGEAVPSTFIEFVSRFTWHSVTPEIPDTAFSTWALHAAQLMPVTLYLVMAAPVISSAFVWSSSAHLQSHHCLRGYHLLRMNVCGLKEVRG